MGHFLGFFSVSFRGVEKFSSFHLGVGWDLDGFFRKFASCMKLLLMHAHEKR